MHVSKRCVVGCSLTPDTGLAESLIVGSTMRPLISGRSAEAMDAIPETRASVVEIFMFDNMDVSFKRIYVGGGLL